MDTDLEVRNPKAIPPYILKAHSQLKPQVDMGVHMVEIQPRGRWYSKDTMPELATGTGTVVSRTVKAQLSLHPISPLMVHRHTCRGMQEAMMQRNQAMGMGLGPKVYISPSNFLIFTATLP